VELAYKHLGTLLSALLDHAPARERLVRRCKGVLGALARLGVLSPEHFAECADASIEALMCFYGRATPIGRAACAEIEKARPKNIYARLRKNLYQNLK